MIVAMLAATLMRPEPVSRSEQRPAMTEAPHDWAAVADCESGGDWHINTGNSFYGGLQITEQTWDGFGGQDFAARPDLASEGEQITVAERILHGQGIGAWPTCGFHLYDRRAA